MDTKKVLERLIKIADNQQKIINKLAQQTIGVPAAQPMSGGQPEGDPNQALASVVKSNLKELLHFDADAVNVNGLPGKSPAIDVTATKAPPQITAKDVYYSVIEACLNAHAPNPVVTFNGQTFNPPPRRV